MKVSVIIAVYKDIEALNLIFDSLSRQTYKNFEVVVAEDGDSEVMLEAVKDAQQKYEFDIVHTRQEDIGVRKSKSQNNGIRASSGEYLIFIDGDCLLYSNFIENHLALSGEKSIVTGRRVNVGPKYSQALREKNINVSTLEKSFLRKYFDIKKDAKEERHSEEGFLIRPFGVIHKLMIKLRKKEFPLLGCNMSFYKKAIEDINGFDEGLGNSAMASDTDLEWRFKGLGYRVVSARYIANEFHLYHKRSPQEYDRGLDIQMMQNRENKVYRCIDGLTK
ncbi:MAG: glycosyltransferase [Campylobacterales bacterium]|nr:glycosyltransferase [Campylobacterales bacterium]